MYTQSVALKKYIYIGQTRNLNERFTRHQKGRERTTKSYRPFRLLHAELASNRDEARKIEKYLKSGYGREILKELDMQGRMVELVDTQS